ncbi:MAG: hypothetical protein Q4D99_08125, partial [Bacillota bacterium]|nr:hypothetical protein [Bacillota bacterium]
MNQNSNPINKESSPELLEYEKAWTDYINNGTTPPKEVIPTEVFESWEASRRNGVNPFAGEIQPPLDGQELEARRAANRKAISVAEKYMQVIFGVIGDTNITLDFVDKDGYIIVNVCSPGLDELTRMTWTGLGCNEGEEVSGTTAIALALKHMKPVQISGAQFFLQRLHEWTSAAAPVFDVDGTLLGVIAVSGYYETVHKHTLGIVIEAKSAIENEIHLQNIHDQL